MEYMVLPFYKLLVTWSGFRPYTYETTAHINIQEQEICLNQYKSLVNPPRGTQIYVSARGLNLPSWILKSLNATILSLYVNYVRMLNVTPIQGINKTEYYKSWMLTTQMTLYWENIELLVHI